MVIFGNCKSSVKDTAGRNQSVEQGQIPAPTLSSYEANPVLRIKASTNMEKAREFSGSIQL